MDLFSPHARSTPSPFVASVSIATSIWIAVGCAGCEGRSGDSAAPTEQAAESPEPISLELAGADEYRALIESHRGRVILVDFWATWCTPCQIQFPHTVALARELGPKGLSVLTVSFDAVSDRVQALDFLEKTHARAAQLVHRLSRHGPTAESFDAFGLVAGSIPEYHLFDRDGRLVKRFAIDPTTDPFTLEDIDAAVKALLAAE
jgi:thiol-disulfide isomerase/thioredoxin